MTTAEMKSTVEKIYKIQMAAIKVYEANETYLTAKAAHEAQPYDWTHQDREGNDRWMELTDNMNKKEGLLKKAVNAFFKAVERPDLIKNWDLGFSAILAYNEYIKSKCYGFGKVSPVPGFSLYSCIARKY